MAEDRPAALTLAQAIDEYLDWQAINATAPFWHSHAADT